MADQNDGAQPEVQGVVPQPVPAQALPDNSSDRAKEQFEKLLENNRQLAEERAILKEELRRKNEGVSQETRQTATQQPAQQPKVQDYVEVDPKTGEKFINEEKLTSKLNELTAKASKAEETVNNYIQTSEQREIDRQSKEAYVAHPELDPSNKEKFSAEMNRKVRGVLLDSIWNTNDYGGRALTFREAADFVKKSEAPAAQPAEAEQAAATAKAKADAEAAKQESSAGVTSQPQTVRQGGEDSETLLKMRVATRRGDDEALAARLASIYKAERDEQSS